VSRSVIVSSAAVLKAAKVPSRSYGYTAGVEDWRPGEFGLLAERIANHEITDELAGEQR